MQSRKDETLEKLKEEKAKLQAAAKDAQAKSDELRQKEALTNETKSTMSKVRTLVVQSLRLLSPSCTSVIDRCDFHACSGIDAMLPSCAGAGAGAGQAGRAGPQEGRVRAGAEGPGAAEGACMGCPNRTVSLLRCISIRVHQACVVQHRVKNSCQHILAHAWLMRLAGWPRQAAQHHGG